MNFVQSLSQFNFVFNSIVSCSVIFYCQVFVSLRFLINVVSVNRRFVIRSHSSLRVLAQTVFLQCVRGEVEFCEWRTELVAVAENDMRPYKFTLLLRCQAGLLPSVTSVANIMHNALFICRINAMNHEAARFASRHISWNLSPSSVTCRFSQLSAWSTLRNYSATNTIYCCCCSRLKASCRRRKRAFGLAGQPPPPTPPPHSTNQAMQQT